MDIEFLEVERAFKRGDPRPLAQWVLTHDMTSEQKEFVAKELNLGTTVVSRVLNKHLGSEKYNEISKKISSWERFIFPIESGITKMQYGKSKFRLKRKEKYLGWFDTIEEAISFKKQYIQNNTWENG